MKRLLALLTLVVALAGCGVRVDAPDPTPSRPSADEVVRQREALRAAAFAAAPPASSPAAATVAAHATEQLAALGGVWVGWPAGDGPTPTSAPTADVAPSTPAELLEALERTTPELLGAAAVVDDPDLATVLAAVAVARTLDAAALATELGAPAPPPTLLPEAIATASPALVRALDAAAWALEVHAAAGRSADAAAAEMLAGRAARLRLLAEGAAAANGWAGTESDPREPVYDVTRLPTAGAVSEALLTALLADLPATPDREAHLAAMISCARTAAAAGVELGALPGL